MSTAVADRTDPAAVSGRAQAGFGDVLRSEWTKLRTLRSTVWTLVAFMVLGIASSLLITTGHAAEYREMSPAEQAHFLPLARSLFGLVIAQLAVAVPGILVMTSEYATGMIVPSLAAVPRRGRLLAAKAVVFTTVAFVVGVVTALGMVVTGQQVFAGQGVPSVDLADVTVLRAIVGAGLYLALLGLLALAVGTLVRWSAGAISVLFAGILLVPSMAGSLPEPWGTAVETYWPTNAGLQVALNGPDGLAPWVGFAVMGGFVAVVLAAASAALRYRDA